MRAMVPIEKWWPDLDVATRLIIQAGPTLTLTADLASRIHDASL